MLLIDKTHEPVVGLDAAESADGFATSSQRLAENHTCTPKVDTHCPYQHQQILLVERLTLARTFACQRSARGFDAFWLLTNLIIEQEVLVFA